MHLNRSRLISALAGTALVTGTVLVPLGPAQAEPDIDEVQARVDKLYRQAEEASERYNHAQVQLEEIRGDLKSLKSDQQRQAEQVDTARSQVEDSVVRQYQGQGVATMAEIVVSEDPSSFLSQMSTMSAFNDMQDQLFDDYSTELESLQLRTDATQDRAQEIAKLKERLAEEKEEIQAKHDEAQETLDELEAEERARLEAQQAAEQERQEQVSRSAAPRTQEIQASGGAAAAVAFAKSQVGKTYVYGASGPNSYDCSGLTSSAWAQAGVSLPRSSQAQMSAGTPVSRSELQPGDLVFYYSPVSHVGIYVGNGQLVHAANPSTGVAYTSVDSMPYSGAVRPG